MHTLHYVIVDFASSPLSDDAIPQVFRMLSNDYCSAALENHFHTPVDESAVGSSVATWAKDHAAAAFDRLTVTHEWPESVSDRLIVNLPDNPILAAFLAAQMNEYNEHPSPLIIRMAEGQVMEVAYLP